MTANRYKSLTNSTDDQIVQLHPVVKVTGAQTLILDEWDVSLATNRSILALLRITIRIEEFLTGILPHPLD